MTSYLIQVKVETKKSKKFLSIWTIGLIGIVSLISGLYFINLELGIENFSNSISLPVYTIIPGTLVILSLWAITRSQLIADLPKKSLIFLSASFIGWFLAEQTWNLYEHVFMIDPYPSLADVFYISAPVCMFLALLLFLKSTKKKISKKNIIFAVFISLIIVVPTLFATLEGGLGENPAENMIAIAYPISDGVLLVPAIITITFLLSSKLNFFWIMILAGIIIMFAADIIFLFLVIGDEYVDGHPVDILWVTSYTIWSFMMVYAIVESKKKSDNKETEIYEKYGSKITEKYGVLFGLVLINSTVGGLLFGINYLTNPNPEDTTLPFFSWIFVMMVIIFSSVIILLNSKLNRTLQNRTRQLENISSELIKSERFSAIGELASRISHDIRNPLSNIQMSIELLKNSPPETKIGDEKISEKLELATKNIERISHQVNDVLGFVKDQNMKKENFELSSCLKDSIESINLPNNIRLKISKTDLLLFGDKFQMQIVFNNIIINAIQAIGKNDGEIIIDSKEEKNSTIIEIKNSGPPIPEDVLPHIFESLVTTKQIGTGLGLVSCKTIIENHNGKIYAENNPTKFVIQLPKH